MSERWIVNPRGVVPAVRVPSRVPLEFHRRLPGYEPTPLVVAPPVADAAGVRAVWVKDESSRLGLPSFKILGASWAAYRALDEHIGGFGTWQDIDDLRGRLRAHLPPALAAATDGNHGRAVARMAALLGLDARIFVPAGTATARIDAIASEGASCEIVEGTYDDAVARAAAEASSSCLVISDTSWEGYTRVPAWVIEGYSTIFWEIDDALNASQEAGPATVVIQIGVGALAAAAAAYFRAVRPETILAGVEPDRAACVLASVAAGEVVTIPGPHDSIMAGLNCGTPSVVAWPIVSHGFDVFAAIDDERARNGMRMLARAGLVSGETGAAGAGALEFAAGEPALGNALGLGPDVSVLVLSTEGATDPEAYERIVGRPP